jgi:hypothetical protein
LSSTPRSSSPSGTARTGRRSRPVRRYQERSLFDRYRGVLLAAFALAGVALVGFLFVSQASGRSFACRTELAAPPDQVTEVSETPAASPSASPAAESASPGASPSPAAGETAAPDASPSPSAPATPELGFVAPDLGREHVRRGQTIDYAYCPPTSGMHFNAAGDGPIRRDFYASVDAPGSVPVKDPGGWLHNLEHGYVVALYSCGDDGSQCPTRDEMTALRRFFDEAPTTEGAEACGEPNKMIVARFDQMSTRFALVAWDRALLVDTFDVDQAKAFAQQFTDGRAAPERFACGAPM